MSRTPARRRLIFAAAVVVLTTVAFVPASAAAPQTSSGPPALHALSPTAVPVAGARIAVGGSRLKQVHSVSFAAAVVRKIHHVSSTRLTVRAPEHALGRVAVTLHGTGGSSQVAHLSYVRPPASLQWHFDGGIDPPSGDLTDLSCVTESFCVAVDNNAGVPTRLLRFGTDSAPQSTSVPESAEVRTVACGRIDYCVAGPATGAYIWNGATWRGPTKLGRNLPYGPVCARGTRMCMYASNTRTLVHKASGWKTVPLPFGMDVINDISCATATFCEALGYTGRITALDSATVNFERFDGSSWETDNAVTPAWQTYGNLPKVACPTATYCLATDGVSAVQFSSGTWNTIPAPNNDPVDLGVLALDCGAPGQCVSLPGDDPEPHGVTILFANGHWTHVQIPGGGYPSVLSCPSATLCRAADPQGRTFDLVNGGWSTRQLVTASGYALEGVSCASRNWCMAIDAGGNALKWHDGHWSKPETIDIDHGLWTISCSPQRVCTAVGEDEEDGGPEGQQATRTIRYVHGRWQQPEQIDTNGIPYAVSCPTADFCVVIDGLSNRLLTFADGSWSARDDLLNPKLFYQVDCVAAERCILSGIDDHHHETLVLHGHVWRSVSLSSQLGPSFDCISIAFCVDSRAELHDGVFGPLPIDNGGVRCARRTLCIDYVFKPSGRTVIETFDGAAARTTSFPYPRIPVLPYRAITCVPGPLCVALSRHSAVVGTH